MCTTRIGYIKKTKTQQIFFNTPHFFLNIKVRSKLYNKDKGKVMGKLGHQITKLLQKARPFVSVLIFAFVLLMSNLATANEISSLRIGQGVGNVRIVLEGDAKFEYKAFLLSSPSRLVIDTYGMDVNPQIEKQITKNNLISSGRIGTIESNGRRIVFDLAKPAVIKKAFMLSPQSNFGWRFVVDITLVSPREFNSKVGTSYAFTSSDSPSSYAKRNTPKPSTSKKSSSKKIIVLDPGHGGKDPGAIGYSGMYEKNITLAMGKELKKMLEDTGKYKVYMTRSTDIFIPLRERVRISRKHKADLFISLHADSTKNRSAKGLSVYTLSETASDKEAEALAERENKADVIDGLNLVEHSKEVSDILINLAQRETMNRSSEFATFMVQEMRSAAKLVADTHRFAGFAVLKAPDVPSVLLEMGYLSNRTEERLLKQQSYRRKLAQATTRAVNRYFENMKQASLF